MSDGQTCVHARKLTFCVLVCALFEAFSKLKQRDF